MSFQFPQALRNFIGKYFPAFILITLIVVAAMVSKSLFKKNALHAKKEVAEISTPRYEREEELLHAHMEEAVTYSYDFEKPQNLMNENVRSTLKAAHGKWACAMNKKTEFGIGAVYKLSELKSSETLRKLTVSINSYSDENLDAPLCVFTIEDGGGKTLLWKSLPILFTPGKWKIQQLDFYFTKPMIAKDNLIKVYLWNPKKQKFFVDDMALSFYSPVQTEVNTAVVSPQKVSTFVFDYESDMPSANIVSNTAHSGKQCFFLNSSTEYGPSITKKISEVWDDSLNCIQMSAWIKCEDDNPTVVLVAETKDAAGDKLEWSSKNTYNEGWKKGEWKKLNARFNLNPDKKPPLDGTVTAYIWNKGKHNTYVDDVTISFGSDKPRAGEGNATDVASKNATFKKNKYPLRLCYLDADTADDKTTSLLPEALLPEALLPDDIIFTGPFSGKNMSTDEILKVSNNNIQLYAFNQLTKKYERASRYTLGNNVGKSKFYCGHFSTSKTLQLVIVNSEKQLYSFIDFSLLSGSTTNDASEAPSVGIPTIAGLEMSSSIVLPLDITTEKTYLLVINPQTFMYAIIDAAKSSCRIIHTNSFSVAVEGAKESYVTPFVGHSQSRQFILNTKNKAGNTSSYFINFTSEKQKPEIKLFQNNFIARLLTPQSYFLYTNEYGYYLLYTNALRHDIKLIQQNGSSLDAMAQGEFRFFAKDFNPKYYECMQMWPLTINNVSGYYMVASANCKARPADNTQCIKYTTKFGMPNTTALYKFAQQ